MKTLFKIYEELYKAGVKVYSYNLCDTHAVTIEANKQYAIFFNPNAIQMKLVLRLMKPDIS